MKKNVFVFALAVALLLTLAGCGCDHEWYAATCTSPKTCSLCGKTEGEPLPHTWLDATCTAAKTCTVFTVLANQRIQPLKQRSLITVLYSKRIGRFSL